MRTYKALDQNGSEYERPAMVVHELPHKERLLYMEKATAAVEKITGLKAKGKVHFGTKACLAFGLNEKQAAKHEFAKILLTPGESLPLFIFN